jgi:NarL family two-component system response regulator LiaR
MPDKIRVVIVDDHAMVRGGLEMFIGSVPDLELVGQASNGQEAIRVCGDSHPNVVLMDLIMPIMNGVEAIEAIRAANPEIRVIALTSFKDDDLVYGALKAGAVNYLPKDVNYDELAQAIRDAQSGRSAINPEVTQALLRMADKPGARQFQLTERELEVLGLIARGLTNSQIAAELHLSGSTVKFHVSNVLSRLGAASRSEAAALAVQHKLVG